LKSSRIVSGKTIKHVSQQAEFSITYIVLMAMSGILAAISLLTNSIPILVGSMIIAPALAPIALMAFACVGRRPSLALRGLGVAVAGLLIAALASMGTTWVMNVTSVIPPETNLLNKPLLEERVNPGWYSVAAAMASGIAGTIALAQKRTDTLVGVVAALALVPAAAAAGIAFISGDYRRSLGGLALLGINVGLIVMTGIATLLVMRPDQER
jgi:uncharacterized hydrophobic protein (TIGR00271 family)